MRKTMLILFVSLPAFLLHAQNVNFVWAKQMGGAGNGSGWSIATDAVGNVYTTGEFVGTIESILLLPPLFCGMILQ